MKLKLLMSLFLMLFLGACSSKKIMLNQPLDQNQTLPRIKPLVNKNKTSLILTFSGGGTRAAAFSYGVLKGLKKHHLLDNIDIISSVSGGSFTAAYFGLYGNKIFEDYEKKFLKKSIQTMLIHLILNPFNWFQYSFGNRSDYVAAFYEKEIFGKKNFSDLRNKPKLLINATDLSTGSAFAFTRDNFMRICSDLSSYPIGKAVTASSAVPGAFSPLTLKNYDTCKKITKQESKPKNYFLHHIQKQQKDLEKLNDTKRYPYLHLVDGGVSDNLGLRSLFYETSKHKNDFLKFLKSYGIEDAQKILIIVVNAARAMDPSIAQSKENLSIKQTLSATTTTQIKRYSLDTLSFLDAHMKLWRSKAKNTASKELEFYVIKLSFSQFPEKKADVFLRTKTSLELEPKRVDELIKAGEELLDSSDQFNAFLRSFYKSTHQKEKNGILE